MSYEPIDDLQNVTEEALRLAMEPFDVLCEAEGHEFEHGMCVDCGEVDEDYDPTPHGAHLVTDWTDSPSYVGMVTA